jgi:hypothetical protein
MKCQKCDKREATMVWGGDNYCGLCDARGYGKNQRWCAACVAEAQLDYARERAAAIPDLEARLAAVRS